MSSSDGIPEEKVKKLRSHVRKGNCYEVLATYRKERELRKEKITEKGDTVLHLALSSENVWWASQMVSLLLMGNIEFGVEDAVSHVKDVLWAKNIKGNTALHLAASMGNADMCKTIGATDHSLLSERNIDGETPLFLAARSGNKQAFLWLHYFYMENLDVSSTVGLANCIQRNNNDTILHSAIAHGHIDVAIEIFHLYGDLVKELMIKRNKDGLSPLHLLATTPSAFKSTSLHGRFITVHLLYWLLSVKEKERATTREELEREQIPSDGISFRVIDLFDSGFFSFKKKKRPAAKEEMAPRDERIPFFSIYSEVMGILFDSICMPLINKPPVILLGFIIFVLLALLLLLPLSILELFALAEKWLHEIRKMKEKHLWYGQIMIGLLEHASSSEEMREITCYEQPRENSNG